MRYPSATAIGTATLLTAATLCSTSVWAEETCPIIVPDYTRVCGIADAKFLRHIDEIGGCFKITVKAASKWNASGIRLSAKQKYTFEVIDKDKKWFDASIEADAEGWTEKGIGKLGEWSKWSISLLEPLRRSPGNDWFNLMGMVAEIGEKPFSIGNESTLQVGKDGEFCAFANDLPSMYGNNKGQLNLLVSKWPKVNEVKKAIWLQQNWDETERHWFHHASQGTATLPIPYEWFLELEQPIDIRSWFKGAAGKNSKFSDPDYLKKFGFIPSPKSTSNPDGLPVGFAKTANVPNAKNDGTFNAIGLTCAACHTGQLTYKGTGIRIDGGPAMISLTEMGKALATALVETYISPTRHKRFRNAIVRRTLNVNPILGNLRANAKFEKDFLKLFTGLVKEGRVQLGCESRMAVMSAAWFVEFRQRLPWLLHVD